MPLKELWFLIQQLGTILGRKTSVIMMFIIYSLPPMGRRIYIINIIITDVLRPKIVPSCCIRNHNSFKGISYFHYLKKPTLINCQESDWILINVSTYMKRFHIRNHNSFKGISHFQYLLEPTLTNGHLWVWLFINVSTYMKRFDIRNHNTYTDITDFLI